MPTKAVVALVGTIVVLVLSVRELFRQNKRRRIIHVDGEEWRVNW